KPIEILLREQSKTAILCKQYFTLSRDKELFYPHFLSVPRYSANPHLQDKVDYNYIDCYATNSGTATGLNLYEALIHSVSELIERDAISLLLLGLFFKPKRTNVYAITKSSLPQNLRDIANHIESVTNSELIILDITSDFEI